MPIQEPLTATEISERWRVERKRDAEEAMFICEEFQKALDSTIERVKQKYQPLDGEKKC